MLKTIGERGCTDSLREQMYELADMNRLLGADALLAAGTHYASET